MSKSKRPTFEFTGAPANCAPARTETVEHLVDDQPTLPSMRLEETQVRLEPHVVDGRAAALGLSLRQIFERIAAEFRQAKLSIALAFAAGLVIGLPILGWGLWPVEWTGGAYTDLSPKYQQAVVDMAADLATYDPASPAVARFTHLYPGVELNICEQARTTADPGKQQRLRSLNFRVTGGDCNLTVQPID